MSFLKRSPQGLKQSRRALNKLANAIGRLDRQRNSHGILTRFRPRLAAVNRELKSYETQLSEGEDKRVAAVWLRLHVGLLGDEIRFIEGEIKAEKGLSHLNRSPLSPLCAPLQNLKTMCRQLMYGPDTVLMRVLNELIRKSGVTPYAIAAVHAEDPSYIYKLMKGERRNPRRESVRRIATALMECSDRISEKDANRLMRSAGYPPLWR